MSEAEEAPKSASGDLVIASHLNRTYRTKGRAEPVVALRDLSLRIRRGSLTAIRGASGSGKSTLLNLLGGLDLPDSGKLIIDRKNLRKLSEGELVDYRARKVGFVFQTFNLLPTLNARENIEFAMGALRTPAEERESRAMELLDAVGMADRAEHRPSQLSGGEQQRVGIARALSNKPPLILADEPTGNLDRKSRDVVVKLLMDLSQKAETTVVVVTHDPNVADRCEVVHTIKYGRIGRSYTPTESQRQRALAEEDEEEEGTPVAEPSDTDEGDEGDEEEEERPTSKKGRKGKRS